MARGAAVSTRRLRLPSRLLWHVRQSKAYEDWREGKGCLPTDRPLFSAVYKSVLSEKVRADGSLHLDADAALVETVHQWALELTYAPGVDLADTRANVRSGRSVVRQINPREFT
jgi:hypothetical protein